LTIITSTCSTLTPKLDDFRNFTMTCSHHANLPFPLSRFVYTQLTEEIARVNESLPESQKIQKFILLYKELDADDGELTRTRKVRRSVIADKYGDIISSIYDDKDMVDIDTVIVFQDGTKTRIKTKLKVASLLSFTANFTAKIEGNIQGEAS